MTCWRRAEIDKVYRMSYEKPTAEEAAANEAIRGALKALQRAKEFSEKAGYGSLVLGPLFDAQRETQYALDTALGRN